TPDLTTLGKIIGGGLPVGALGGREDVLALFDPREEGRIGHGGTFNANPMTMAAGLATLEELTPGVYDVLEGLAALVVEGVNERTEASATAIGSLFRVDLADPSALPDLHRALLANGILFTPRGMGCLSTPMTSAETDAFVDAVCASL
ncbi:MAG TPA: aminotransferase class III-fold pyridoxal phosphate-dependent enzyme, partial [Gaiellaceae bacterium]|nr:aminotransferase class III-fold pyridoxal phosphate-dependent enzyme [Gaiellaceae bacterium]